jgi:hypothetical protein
MELLWFLGFIAGLVLLGMVGGGVAYWASLHRMKFEARLKQDMLARGLSVEEIERLLRASSGPTPGVFTPSLPLAKGQASNAAFSLAGAIEDMVGCEKKTEEIATFLEIFLERGGEPSETSEGPTQPLESAATAARRAEVQRLSKGLAPALESMVNAGRNRQEIAVFLETFLQRGGEPPEIDKAPDRPFPPIGAAVRSSDIQRINRGLDG